MNLSTGSRLPRTLSTLLRSAKDALEEGKPICDTVIVDLERAGVDVLELKRNATHG